MTDGLKDSHREAIIKVIAANERVEKIVLFGSRAMGTYTTTSDIDLALYGEELTLTDLTKLNRQLIDLPIAQKADLLLFRYIKSAELFEHIRKHGVVWYERKSTAGTEDSRKETGDLSAEWRNLKLGEVISLQRGHDLPEQDRKPGYVPIYGSFGITGYHSVAKAKGPGVTVGRSGASFGVISYSPVDYWPHNAALYVTDFKGNDEKFIYYFLKQFDFKKYNSGSAIPSLNRNFIYPIETSLPPLVEQKAIAHILGTLDDKIELNRKMNETLEAMARALFKSWFVDFDPVRRNMARSSSEAVSRYGPTGHSTTASYRDAELDALFPGEFEDSALGRIPRGWRVGKIKDIGRIITGKTPPTAERSYYGNAIPFITIPDMHNQVFVRSTSRYLSHAGAAYQKDKLLPPGSICVSCIATPGLVIIAAQPSQTNQQINSIVPAKPDTTFYWYHAVKAIMADIVSKGAGGSVFYNVNKGLFEETSIIHPPDELIAAYQLSARSLFEKLRATLVVTESLTEIRDTLLPKLISGELRVPALSSPEGRIEGKDAERFAGADYE
jgi:type I restriction enzyme S subunit